MSKKHPLTTAARSRDFLREAGFMAEVAEHRRGSFIREDLFGFADVMAYCQDGGILLVQAYGFDARNMEKHKDLVPGENEKIRGFLLAGGRFHHHIWHKHVHGGQTMWDLDVKEITL
jgi:hypothetical protein